MQRSTGDHKFTIFRCSTCNKCLAPFQRELHRKECLKRKQDKEKTPDQPTRQDELRLLQDFVQYESTTVTVEETYYILSKRWFLLWQDWIAPGSDSQYPGPIYNEELLENSNLKPNLTEGLDFVVLPSLLWRRLHHWYRGGPKIKRQASLVGLAMKPQVDLYPVFCHFHILGSEPTVLDYQFGRGTLLREILWYLCAQLVQPISALSLVLSNEDNTRAEVIPKERLPDALESFDSDHCWFSVKKNSVQAYTYTPPTTITTNWKPSPLYKNIKELSDVPGSSLSTGVVGFQNLGNTCYLNSVLQCLAHNVNLVNFFIADDFQEYLNTRSITKGDLAVKFSLLLKRIWRGGFKTISPKDFRNILIKMAPQFSGFRQHDAQELLILLLDGLHSDLAETETKTETGVEAEAETETESSVTQTSKVMELFGGEHVSIMTCKSCEAVHKKPEDFTLLSVPIPSKNMRLCEVVYYRLDGTPVRYGVRVHQRDKVLELKKSFCEQFSLVFSKIDFRESFANKLIELDDSRALCRIKTSDKIHAYEVLDAEAVSYTVQAVYGGSVVSGVEPFIISVLPGMMSVGIQEMIFKRLENMYTSVISDDYQVLLVTDSKDLTKGIEIGYDDNQFPPSIHEEEEVELNKIEPSKELTDTEKKLRRDNWRPSSRLAQTRKDI
eukprot:TRINITY_DN8719_c0_g1_i2.p1 TRINITY_DN8719_c0_g1~~TRINITY_DN8719_c0_g1_i2.p1  ORF type:complete len:678 (-),score=98.11 TRINITY_DN8719_c0_g1_i2:1097-3094(-)